MSSSPTHPPVAVVLAAGKGTRMKSAGSKVLFPVLGVPIVQRVVEAARAAGCVDVVVVVGHGAESVQAALPGERFAIQDGLPGTGGAVAAARGALDFRGRTVLVLPGDVPLMQGPTLAALLEDHEAQGSAVTVATMRVDDATGYGRIVRDGAEGPVRRIVEHKDATEAERRIQEVNTSIYAFDGSFLFGDGPGDDGAIGRLSPENAQREYLLTDVVAIAVGDDQDVGASVIEDALETAGINDRAQLADLEATLRHRINLAWLKAGVSMDDPDSVRIEESVRLERDVTLGAGVELRGGTVVCAGSTIGKGSILDRCEVGAGCVVGPYVVATRASLRPGSEVRPFSVLRGINEKRPDESTSGDRVRLGERAVVGPFAHLRQASVLGDGAKVGNFVELKKTDLHAGAKANHLAYLGDTTVGARSNVGAGVITCNYDGFAKHRTTIGADAFIGTDSHLVAPIRVGDGAYVGTGTTVTRDVPDGALAIGRARQSNKEGYADRLRTSLARRAEAVAEAAAKAARRE
jgi:bifunctional UDP-N-acetylglucosamine pyrophosphorylase/glucosamine-1-phosphate N-acetyltransferase